VQVGRLTLVMPAGWRCGRNSTRCDEVDGADCGVVRRPL